jgi:hypothetical protein
MGRLPVGMLGRDLMALELEPGILSEEDEKPLSCGILLGERGEPLTFGILLGAFGKPLGENPLVAGILLGEAIALSRGILLGWLECPKPSVGSPGILLG